MDSLWGEKCEASTDSILFFFSSRRRHTRLQGDWSSDVCSSDLHNFGILAESRGLRLSAVDTRCVVRSDEALLRRILQNFLSNAIRYTRQGRIVIGCRRQGQQLRIEVHDQDRKSTRLNSSHLVISYAVFCLK